MLNEIEAIFFDMGGTLRTRVPDAGYRQEGLTGLVTLLGVSESSETFLRRLSARAKAYKRWAEETLIEAPETEIWTRWMLPDYPTEQIEPLAGQLTHLWRLTQGRRVARSDARTVVAELVHRGYHLGVISNTTSPVIVPQGLVAYGVAAYFSVVVLSSTFGRRKPDPTIFWEATRRMGVQVEHCAYVGDRFSRDIIGSRRASFAMSILINDGDYPQDIGGQQRPGAIIQSLSELLDIF